MQRAYDENNPPDALERIFQGPLNWMNLVIIGVNILVFAVMEICGDTQDINFMLKWGAAYTPWILDGAVQFNLYGRVYRFYLIVFRRKAAVGHYHAV